MKTVGTAVLVRVKNLRCVQVLT